MKGSRFEKRADVKAEMSVSEFVHEMRGAGFTAKRLSEAVEIYKMMVDDKECVKVLTAAGALIAGGMRNSFGKMIRGGLVDVFITTGGSVLTHDLIEAFGVHHKQGSAFTDDVKLAKENVVRIYDVFLDKKGYVVLEDEVQSLLKSYLKKRCHQVSCLESLVSTSRMRIVL